MRQAYLRSHPGTLASSIVVGAITIALDKVNGTRMTAVGVAFCAPNDQFNRTKGRAMAHERCIEGEHKYHFCIGAKEARHNDAVVETLAHLLINNLYPNWAKPLILQQLAIHSTCVVNNKIFGGS